MQLDESQQRAVELVIASRFGVVTGGPGTGKSTCLKAALDELDLVGEHYALASPTGKAARRMTEAAGGLNVPERQAKTIHRLLEWQRGDFTRNENNPLEADVVIVDEASMLDIELAASLVRALRKNARLILVGDANQLPSVGPGRLLADLVESGDVPVARLTHVHRSAAESWICRNAPKVLAGTPLELDTLPDFRFFEADDAASAAELVRRIVRMPEYQGAQVLSPQRTVACGTVELNVALQAQLNPAAASKPEWKYPDRVLRTGDRVIQTVNNYTINVFNGEVGTVKEIVNPNPLDPSATDAIMRVDFGDRVLEFSKASASHLELAYALTVHKCVAPDTLVETANGLMPIRDAAALGFIGTPDGPRAYDRKVRNPPARALRVVCEGGYEITVTPDHKLMAWTGDQYELTEAQHLRPGMFTRLKLGATCEPLRPSAMPAAPVPGDVREAVYPVPAVMTEELAEFLGLMVADGTVFRSGFRLLKEHPDVAHRFAELARKLFAVVPKISAKPATGRQKEIVVTTVEISSVYLARWLLDIGGLAPNAKAIPASVLRASLHMHAAFLRGLFEDGTVNIKGDKLDHVEWSSCYPEMAKTVQTMLLRFGVICSIRQIKAQHVLYIYGQNAARFGLQIGFVSEFKQSRLAMPTALTETKYLIPVAHGHARHVDLNANSRGYVSRSTAGSLADPYILEAYGFHHARVELVEETISESLCVRVPGVGRFVQNGFDGSNCQGSEFPWIICVVHSSHTHMLSRQLFYTAITRAKKGVVLVGNRNGIDVATSAKEPPKRNTMLVERMRKARAELDEAYRPTDPAEGYEPNPDDFDEPMPAAAAEPEPAVDDQDFA